MGIVFSRVKKIGPGRSPAGEAIGKKLRAQSLCLIDKGFVRRCRTLFHFHNVLLSLKILRRLNEIEDLPAAQQKILFKTIDTFLKAASL